MVTISLGYFKGLLKPTFSARDSHPVERRKEEAAFMHLLDFLEECEGMQFYREE